MSNMTRRASFHDLVGRMLEETIAKPFAQDSEEGLLPVDISQTEKDVVVRASIPGFRKEDVDVRVEKGVLSIKASKQAEEVNGERYYRRERFTGSLSRRIALPGMVRDHDSTAELRDGVLTLRVPIAEEAKPKQIVIQ